MCMEDVKLGRDTPVVEQVDTVPNTSSVFVDDDRDRTLLVFFPPPSGTLTLSIKTPAVANEGIILTAGNLPVVLDIKTHGQMVIKRWYAIHSVGGVKVARYLGRLNKQ